MATTRLESNDSFYSSKRTKHINAIYFFIKGKLEDVELEVQYLPTKHMLTEILNHSEQRMKFLRIDNLL